MAVELGPAGGTTKKARQAAVPESTHPPERAIAVIQT
jgi:hypothetical protein